MLAKLGEMEHSSSAATNAQLEHEVERLGGAKNRVVSGGG